MFGLIVFVTENISAQNLCSKNSDGNQIDLMVSNATGKAFTLNPVDEDCQETNSAKQISPNEMFQFTSHKDAVLRVREVGSGRLLGEILVNPEKPEMIVQTDLDDSNSRIMYLEATGAITPTTKTLAVDTSGKLCSKKSGANPITIKWLNKTNESLQIRLIKMDCQEESENEGKFVWRDKTFETTAYPGYVYKIYRIDESDEGGYEDFQTITVTDSNGTLTLTGSNSFEETPVSNTQNLSSEADQIAIFKKNLIGTWKGDSIWTFDGKTFTSKNVGAGRQTVTNYQVLDELSPIVPNGKVIKTTMENIPNFLIYYTLTLEDNNNTLIWHPTNANSGGATEKLIYKRVK